MRVPAPVRNVARELRWQESHAGDPLVMRVFMNAARLAAYCLASIPLAGLARVLPLPWSFAFLAGWFVLIIPMENPGTVVDVFTPLGFRLFKWALVQR